MYFANVLSIAVSLCFLYQGSCESSEQSSNEVASKSQTADEELTRIRRSGEENGDLNEDSGEFDMRDALPYEELELPGFEETRDLDEEFLFPNEEELAEEVPVEYAKRDGTDVEQDDTSLNGEDGVLFEKRPMSMLRLGKRPMSMLRLGKRPMSMLRLGKRPMSMLRLGKRPMSMLRLGKRPMSMLRLGKRPMSMLRLGKRPMSMLRLGKRPMSMLRLGKRPMSMLRLGKRPMSMLRLGKR